MDVEVILISELPLPFHKVASWTRMYDYLFRKSDQPFDHIVCPEVNEKLKGISYEFIRDINVVDKIKNRLPSKTLYNNYIEALERIIDPDKRYVIQIVDNSGIVVPINKFLSKKFDRKDFYIQYYFHGFAPIVSINKGDKFLGAIDEFFFLTQLSYQEYLKFYNSCPFKARIIHNGIDIEKFKPVSESDKLNLRLELGLNNDEIIFTWCSQDRPKKGLHIALEAFKEVHKTNPKTKLIVVGINRVINQSGVINTKRIPNEDLAKYYQLSDIFLFPTLWKEGFGIVLAEAMHCGCYIIASDQGGVREVLGNGKYGKLIDKPNLVEEWVNAMHFSVEELKSKGNQYNKKVPEGLYSIESWYQNMTMAITEAKQKLVVENI
ncbi:glycosyltransferase family 4 protein [Winogradskyella poriferorum]|uniref:glycosyltransferase family 4 protein n=1 Tax=Winogradskyella poriferorum TaxID=307627 RepID=UPI003D64F261